MWQQDTDRVLCVAINTDTDPGLAKQWDVQAVPTLLRIEGGRETRRLIGWRPEETVRAFFAPA